MSIKLKHSGGNSVIIAPPSSNPAADRTITLPSTASGNLLTSTSGSSIQVLEQFYSPCDGSIIATSGGNITLGNVTARQQFTDTSFTDITGSSVSYVPPTGTTQVIYTFQFRASSDGDNHGIMSCNFLIDGTEATDARIVERFGNNYYDKVTTFTWGINIGGSATAATGRLASWTSAKTLKMQGNEHGSSNQSQVHYVQNYGGNAVSGRPFVVKPCVGITAIGVPS